MDSAGAPTIEPALPPALRWWQSRTLLRCLLVSGAVLWILFVHMLLLATSQPVLHRQRIAIAGWPAGAPPVTIALLSDIHTSSPGDTPAALAATVARVDALKPDLILLAGDFLATGDYGAHEYEPPAAIAPLAGLHAPLGVLAVPGNHDFWRMPEVSAALTGAGIPLLVDEAVRRGPITIIGIADWTHSAHHLQASLAEGKALGGVPILLSHEPDAIPVLPRWVPLALVGHTHCGQIAPPPFGPILTSSKTGRRYACGLIREGRRISITTGGLGISGVPLRLGAAPDFWLIELGPPAKS
jgi:predicted MPP superfamily phosphohydrolase